MSNKNKKKTGRMNLSGVLPLILAGAVLAVIVLLVILVSGNNDHSNEKDISQSMQVGNLQKVDIDLGHGLEVVEAGRYAGIYMEDGTDEIVSDILMIIVKNNGNSDVQYAEIEIPIGNRTAYFTLSTLPAGETIVLLEKNRMAYQNVDIATAISKNVAMFQMPVSKHEDKLEVQSLNGILNVTNISGEDITKDIVIYYKNASSDLLYGGITYRVTIKGGLKADEVKQVVASHFTANGSRVMWVTVG